VVFLSDLSVLMSELEVELAASSSLLPIELSDALATTMAPFDTPFTDDPGSKKKNGNA
jgi:hypothetical protein